MSDTLGALRMLYDLRIADGKGGTFPLEAAITPPKHLLKSSVLKELAEAMTRWVELEVERRAGATKQDGEAERTAR